MKHQSILSFLCLGMLLSLSSCWTFGDNVDFPEGNVEGYKPIYSTTTDLTIEWQSPKAITTSGKIYTLGDLIFLNDRFLGIHVIDNSDPTSPTKLGFLKVEGAIDMAIRNKVLYINQYSDLVSIDISNIDNIHVIDREEGLFAQNGYNALPPERGVYFECVDDTKGKVVGWDYTVLESPKCYY